MDSTYNNKQHKQYMKRLSDKVPRSVACLIGRHDECTQRGYRHHIPAHLSGRDLSPCQCECQHTVPDAIITADILEAYAGGTLT